MDNTNQIIEKARKYVEELISTKVPREYVYHDFNHTKRVLKNALEIAAGVSMSEEDREILSLAALFHDTGYSESYKENEEIGASIADTFLLENNYPREKIKRVRSAILATRMPQKPMNFLEQVLCDADLSNLGKKSFFENSEKLKKEAEFIKKKNIPKDFWCKLSLHFLEEHEYHTDYAKELYNDRKAKNLIKIKKIISEKKEQNNMKTETKSPEKKAQTAKDVFSKKPPGRGIETMFRNNLRGHLELSALADNKANIMLSVNAVIISILVPLLFPKLYEFPQLVIPTAILIIVCATTIIFATISTRPKVTSGIFKKEDILSKKANLLYFGNFHSMDIDVFEWGMKEMMKDSEFLYGSMIRDFYNLGRVLQRKYKYLKICYNVFMYGLVIALLAFFIAFIFSHKPS